MPKLYLVCSEVINGYRRIRLFLAYNDAVLCSNQISGRDFYDVTVEKIQVELSQKIKIGANFVVALRYAPYLEGVGLKDTQIGTYNTKNKPYIGNGNDYLQFYLFNTDLAADIFCKKPENINSPFEIFTIPVE